MGSNPIWNANFTPSSSNGKTAAFDSANEGSIPSLGANLMSNTQQIIEIMIYFKFIPSTSRYVRSKRVLEIENIICPGPRIGRSAF